MAKLKKAVVSTISCQCRDLGYGVESLYFRGYWTGQVDTWGKLTVHNIDSEEMLYLFPDEIVGIEAI